MFACDGSCGKNEIHYVNPAAKSRHEKSRATLDPCSFIKKNNEDYGMHNRSFIYQ
jgi:hypothetical protein